MSRNLDKDILRDEFLMICSIQERYFWCGLIIAMADDQGRFINNPLLIRATVFPGDDIPQENISDTINKFIEAGKLYRYQAEGKDLLQIVKWWKYQCKSSWMAASKYPAPEHWIDRIKIHGPNNSVITDHWDHPGGFNGRIPTPLPNGLPTDVPTSVPTPLPNGLHSREVKVKGKGIGKGEFKPEKNNNNKDFLGGIFRLYENEIGVITPMIADALRMAEKDYPAGWLEEAIRAGARRNVRNWSYVEAILKRWKRDGKNAPFQPVGIQGKKSQTKSNAEIIKEVANGKYKH